MTDSPVKRNHHFVPKFHLAGFTKKGSVDSPLWVFDTKTGQMRESKPVRVAFQKDLYRVDLPDVQPDALEDVFAEVENKVAPIIKEICNTLVMPTGDDYIWLMNYIALLAERPPVRREVFTKPMEKVQKLVLQMMFETPERYEAIRQKMIKDGKEVSDIPYEELRRFAYEEKYSISFDNNTHLQNLLTSVDTIIPLLIERKWSVAYCPPELGDFICSDNPVDLHWTDQKDRGFWSSPGYGLKDTEVSVPLSSRVMLLGRFIEFHPRSGIIPSRRSLAVLNSYTGSSSDRFIFSRKKDFFWYTRDDKIGNIEDFRELLKKGI